MTYNTHFPEGYGMYHWIIDDGLLPNKGALVRLKPTDNTRKYMTAYYKEHENKDYDEVYYKRRWLFDLNLEYWGNQGHWLTNSIFLCLDIYALLPDREGLRHLNDGALTFSGHIAHSKAIIYVFGRHLLERLYNQFQQEKFIQTDDALFIKTSTGRYVVNRYSLLAFIQLYSQRFLDEELTELMLELSGDIFYLNGDYWNNLTDESFDLMHIHDDSHICMVFFHD